MPAVVLSNCTVGNSLGLSGLGTIWDSISSAVQQCLIAMAVIVCSANALSRFSRWFWQSKFIYLLPLWLSWLMLMGFTHGFLASSVHGQGLLSGALLALVLLFVCYLFSSIKSRWILLIVPVLLFVVVF